MNIETIYAELAPKLSKYLMGNGLSYATTCDIVQETFLRVWQRKDSLSDDMSQISGLVFTIARNYRNDLCRKSRHESLQDEITDADLAEGTDSSASPRGQMEDDETGAVLRRKLRDALDAMPTQLLETFVRARLGNSSISEMAKDLNLSESNVKVRIHRAKNMFRKIFEENAVAKAKSAELSNFDFLALKVIMMLSAVDGCIAKEEMAVFRELAGDIRKTDEEGFAVVWREALKSASYIGFLAETLDREELVKEFVREAGKGFVDGMSAVSEDVRSRVFAGMTAIAMADGDFSQIERDCITALMA